ncbi:MAG: 50S ribosomal protein L18 [Candidatus Colwellbacteria bacterium]|nr:50S ribosomal protein L18 [Candidatus Colwellbacteria bacterium]
MNKQKKILNRNEKRRAKRTRAKLFGTAERPRFSVNRSNRYLYAQVIDDTKAHTLFAGSTKELEAKGNKSVKAAALGESMAKKAKEAGIEAMVFDRGSYKYHGRVKSVAEALRSSGIKI